MWLLRHVLKELSHVDNHDVCWHCDRCQHSIRTSAFEGRRIVDNLYRSIHVFRVCNGTVIGLTKTILTSDQLVIYKTAQLSFVQMLLFGRWNVSSLRDQFRHFLKHIYAFCKFGNNQICLMARAHISLHRNIVAIKNCRPNQERFFFCTRPTSQ